MLVDNSKAAGAGSGPADEKPAQTISVTHVLFMAGIHLGAVAAFAWFSWSGFFTMLALDVVTGFGITVGYHRLL